MDTCFRSTIAQDKLESTPLRPSRLHMPRSYQMQPPSAEKSFGNRLAQSPSLPSLQLPKVANSEPSFRNRVQNIKRPSSSASTIRRSVSGMKRLLPLKLTSPPLPSSRSWNSSTLDSKATFESSQQTPNHTAQLASSDAAVALADKRPQITSRPKQYRDTPIYTQPGSPLPSRAYYSDEDICRSCSPGSLCDESCIIEGYSSNEDSGPDTPNGGSVDFFGNEEEISTAPTSPLVGRARHSELSFKCLGDTFFNEGTWLRSASNRWNNPKSDCLPQILADSMPASIDIEGWISDSTGSSCGESEDDDDFACATALAPARAQVVDVNPAMDLNIIIPPRSSSLARGGSQLVSKGRKSRMTQRRPITPHHGGASSDDEENAPKHRDQERSGRSTVPRDRVDLARASPPLSPEQSPGSDCSSSTPVSRAQAIASIHRTISVLAPGSDHSLGKPNATPNNAEILAALERSISGFPSSMLLLDAPCISLIRTHLQKYAISPEITPPVLHSPFPTPAERRFHRSPLSTSPNRHTSNHPLQKYTPIRPSTPLSRSFLSLSQLDTVYPSPTTTLSSPLRSPPFLASEPRPLTSKSSNISESRDRSTPNLQPFRTIFPKTSDFMRSALYAHILAYLYITTLTHPGGLPHHIAFPLYTSHLTNPSDGNIPSKAASTLGLPSSTKIPLTKHSTFGRISNNDSFSVLIAGVEEGLSSCIRKLVGGMEGRVGWSTGGGNGDSGRFLDRAFLRALVEVVRGCEMRDLTPA